MYGDYYFGKPFWGKRYWGPGLTGVPPTNSEYFGPRYFGRRFFGIGYWGRGTITPSAWSSAVGQGTHLDWLQVLKRSFDPTEQAMRMVSAGAPSGDTPGPVDVPAIFKEVFDPDSNALRIVEVT